MRQLPAPLRRVLALTLLLAVFIVAWVAVIRPIVLVSIRSRAEAGEMRSDVERLSALAAERPMLETRLQALAVAELQRKDLLQGNGSPAIGAALQVEMRTIIEAARGEIRTAQISPVTTEGSLDRIGVRFDLES
jgi:hypothetical protein